MSRVVVLGAGIAGHTAAAFARKWLGRDDTVTVVSPRPEYNWVPSNIWVGVGLLRPAKVTFPLAPVYERAGIEFVQAAAREIHPEGYADTSSAYVVAEAADGTPSKVPYDFVINATGPALRFDKTEGLGPEAGNSLSVCLPEHAAEAAAALDQEVERMRRGEKRRFLVGVGHGTCTCEGAAFEYIVNLEFELRHRGVRDRAEITWITNEYELGDFGMGGMHLKRSGYITPSSIFNASLFAERGIDWITRAHVQKVERDRVFYEAVDGASTSRASISRCCCRRSRASDSKRLTARAPTSPTGCSCPAGSCGSTPTTRPSPTSNGRRPIGRGPTSRLSTPTCSQPGSRSRRHTRSRSPTRAPTAP